MLSLLSYYTLNLLQLVSQVQSRNYRVTVAQLVGPVPGQETEPQTLCAFNAAACVHNQIQQPKNSTWFISDLVLNNKETWFFF